MGGTVNNIEAAIDFRANTLRNKPFSLAVFPASCSPPTKQHMEIVRMVSELPFVDQVWLDLNYQSLAKDGLPQTFDDRIKMTENEISKIPGADLCTLSKDLDVCNRDLSQDTREQKTREYWNVCRVLAGARGTLSWVIGGDVLKSMVYWKKIGKIGLNAVDKLIVFSRGNRPDQCREYMDRVMEDDGEYWKEKVHFIITGDISSTKAREAMTVLLSSISLDTLAHLSEHPDVMKRMVGWDEPGDVIRTPRFTMKLVKKKEGEGKKKEGEGKPKVQDLGPGFPPRRLP